MRRATGSPASGSASRALSTGGYSAAADDAAERAVALLAAEGAEIVDGTDLESMAGFDDDNEITVLLSELRADLATYLPTRGGDGPQTLQDVVDFNRANADRELAHFGQGLFELALTMPEVGSPEYDEARAACLAKGRDEGIDRVLREHELDALVTPAYAPAIPIDLVNPEHHWGSCTQPAAMAGYPLVTVPSGLAQGLPVAVTFWGDRSQRVDADRGRARIRGRARPHGGSAARAVVPVVRLTAAPDRYRPRSRSIRPIASYGARTFASLSK
jgi:amidase